jgi:hypothetical protein
MRMGHRATQATIGDAGDAGDDGDDGDDGDKWRQLTTIIPWMLNNEKLSIGDETKLKSLTENLMQKTEGRN